MTGEPVELSLNTEAAAVLAALVETAGGRWPAHPARIARMLRRLGIDGKTEQMAAAITALVRGPVWSHRAREITSSASGLVGRIGSFTWGDDMSPSWQG
jgi:hypothetical protein